MVLFSAISALRDLGGSAAPALAAIDALGTHDPDPRVRELAKRAGEQIRSNTPAPVEVTRLREELERLRRAQEELKQRLEKTDRVDKKGAQ
jgi:hypothetical protein